MQITLQHLFLLPSLTDNDRHFSCYTHNFSYPLVNEKHSKRSLVVKKKKRNTHTHGERYSKHKRRRYKMYVEFSIEGKKELICIIKIE